MGTSLRDVFTGYICYLLPPSPNPQLIGIRGTGTKNSHKKVPGNTVDKGITLC